MHPLYANAEDHAALYALLDRTWPGLARKIEIAARYGWRWDDVTTPFVACAAGQIVAHVGVLDLPVRLGGADRRVAGLHAVCTEPAHRRRGHYRAAMEEALAFVDSRWPAAKLHTERPEVYEPFGFRVVPQHRFRLRRGGPAGLGRRLREADLPALREFLRRRVPVSEVFAARDEGWLFGICEVLASGGLGRVSLLDEPMLFVVSDVVGGVLRVHDVVALTPPTLDDVLATAPAAFEVVELWMPADVLAPGAEPLPYPSSDILMVRGAWPDLPRFAVGQLASH